MNLWTLHEILNNLKQSWRSYFVYFGSQRFWKTWLRKCLNSPASYHHSSLNMLEGPKHLWNLHESTFIKLCCISEGDWLRKPLLLVIFVIFPLFVRTLTAGDKYSLCNIWNLGDLIQMQLSKKSKNLLWNFFSISEMYIKF